MSELPQLHADCDACAALCCVALAFDEGPSFAIDKPAGLPCPHLQHHACSLYDRLDDAGFSGCSAYDCEGAGQRTLAVYSGISWRDDVELLVPMLETFRHLRTLHSLIALLETSKQLPLEDDELAILEPLLEAMCDPDMMPEDVERVATGSLPTEVQTFLRSLAHHV